MVVARIFLGACCLWFICLRQAFEAESALVRWACGLACFLSAAWVLSISVEYEKKFPCVAYEETLHYNAATKTMMPMRMCVQRGEWVPNEQP